MENLPRAVLADVIAAVADGGRMLAAEFSRPGGPRGGEHKAPIDLEIELMLRPRLLALIPGRFIGEEDGIVEAPNGSPPRRLRLGGRSAGRHQGVRRGAPRQRGLGRAAASRRAGAGRGVRADLTGSRPRHDRLGGGLPGHPAQWRAGRP